MNSVLEISDELRRLAEEGYGIMISRRQMKADKIFPSNECFGAFLKLKYNDIDKHFFELCPSFSQSEGDKEHIYIDNMGKGMCDKCIKILHQYHPRGEAIIDPSRDRRGSKPRPRNALDDLLDEQRANGEKCQGLIITLLYI